MEEVAHYTTFNFIQQNNLSRIHIGGCFLSSSQISALKLYSTRFVNFLLTGNYNKNIILRNKYVFETIFIFLDERKMYNSLIWREYLKEICECAEELELFSFEDDLIIYLFQSYQDLNQCIWFKNDFDYNSSLFLQLLRNFIWKRVKHLNNDHYSFFLTYPFSINELHKIYWCLLKCFDPKFGNLRINTKFTSLYDLFDSKFTLISDERSAFLVNKNTFIIYYKPYELNDSELNFLTYDYFHNYNENEASVVYNLIKSQHSIGNHFQFLETYWYQFFQKYNSESYVLKEDEVIFSLFQSELKIIPKLISTRLSSFLNNSNCKIITMLLTKFMWKKISQNLNDKHSYFISKPFFNSRNLEKNVSLEFEENYSVTKHQDFKIMDIFYMCLLHILKLENCIIYMDSRFKLAFKYIKSKPNVEIKKFQNTIVSSNFMKINIYCEKHQKNE